MENELRKMITKFVAWGIMPSNGHEDDSEMSMKFAVHRQRYEKL